ncbi:MAG: sodium-independent anion transporter, partial [Bacteroidales bacterium]|nr:sodium-independent anion transporter [Bacteroidales bacterium]
GYSSQEMTNFDKESPWDDEHGMLDTVAHKIYIQRLNGPIFFGTINKFKEVMATVPLDAKIVIIRMRLVSFMDQSGLYAMEEAVKDLQARGAQVLMTIIQPQPMYMLTKMNLIPDLVPENHTFKTFEDCTDYLKNLTNEKPDTETK